jgi:hypothetical protein
LFQFTRGLNKLCPYSRTAWNEVFRSYRRYELLKGFHECTLENRAIHFTGAHPPMASRQMPESGKTEHIGDIS